MVVTMAVPHCGWAAIRDSGVINPPKPRQQGSTLRLGVTMFAKPKLRHVMISRAYSLQSAIYPPRSPSGGIQPSETPRPPRSTIIGRPHQPSAPMTNRALCLLYLLTGVCSLLQEVVDFSDTVDLIVPRYTQHSKGCALSRSSS
jgi:hypothetical protein